MARHAISCRWLATGLLLVLFLPLTSVATPQARVVGATSPAAGAALKPPWRDVQRAPTSDESPIWNTFLGGPNSDTGEGIAVDSACPIVPMGNGGHVYVVGASTTTWGSPLRAYSGSTDAFVAKLDGDGTLIWSTFLGGPDGDLSTDITVGRSGDVYVTGRSGTTWGLPKRAHSGHADAFVARLDGDGALIWNTFLGGPDFDYGTGIAVDGSGRAYVTGDSTHSWGSPLRAFSGGGDAFVARLEEDGALTWHTFLGGWAEDRGSGIAVDGACRDGEHSGPAFVVGTSYEGWGSPVRDFAGGEGDAFVARLEGDGTLTWHTFLGAFMDFGRAIAVDDGGHLYVAGVSDFFWGAPLRAHSGDWDAFVARLEGDGTLTWNTFLGGSNTDTGEGIAVDNTCPAVPGGRGGQVYVTGDSEGAWGSPLRAFAGDRDTFVARLQEDGALTWNTFLGGEDWESRGDIVVGGRGHIHASGYSMSTWGSPLRDYSGGGDAFVAHIGQPCLGDGIYLYEEVNYEGRCRSLLASDPDLAAVAFDDIASSIRFVGSYGGGRYEARVYENVDYEGALTAFGADDPDFGDDAIGRDEASSIRVEAVWDGPRIYLPAVLRSGVAWRE